MDNVDLNQLEKAFVDKFVVGFGKDHFVVGLLCGKEWKTFAFGRTSAKEFLQGLATTVEKSEQMLGKITLDSGIASPIQFGGTDTTPEHPQQPKKQK